MDNIRNQNDNTDPIALGPVGPMVEIKTMTSYNEPGLPTPPAGWGRALGTEVKLAPDTCC